MDKISIPNSKDNLLLYFLGLKFYPNMLVCLSKPYITHTHLAGDLLEFK